MPRSDETAGLFLHPAIDTMLYEHAVIQGHSITFATVNLSASSATIRSEMHGSEQQLRCCRSPHIRLCVPPC